MEESREWQCLIKTRRDCFAQVQSTIRETHSYQVPAILAFPVLEGSRSYLEWMEQELQGKGEE
jgi:periplasmic divalent cation tolerance protein